MIPRGKPRVVVVDDETQMRRLLRVCLERNGYDVFDATTGQDGIALTAQHSPDAVLLDLGLPDMEGMTALQRIREWTQIPILVVSVRGHENDKIAALNNGADDYITKPFSTGELMARLNAARRRVQSDDTPVVFKSGRLEVNLATRTVKVSGARVKLTATEYSLLHLFVTNAGKALTHAQILKVIWSDETMDRIGHLRVYMAYLREKLEKNPAEPELLVTEPGVGYRLVHEE